MLIFYVDNCRAGSGKQPGEPSISAGYHIFNGLYIPQKYNNKNRQHFVFGKLEWIGHATNVAALANVCLHTMHIQLRVTCTFARGVAFVVDPRAGWGGNKVKLHSTLASGLTIAQRNLNIGMFRNLIFNILNGDIFLFRKNSSSFRVFSLFFRFTELSLLRRTHFLQMSD